jgi:hypothetical protein
VLAAISYPPIPIFELGPRTLSLHGPFAGLGFVAGAFLMLRAPAGPDPTNDDPDRPSP